MIIHIEEQRENIRSWFDSMYEELCVDDSQIDENNGMLAFDITSITITSFIIITSIIIIITRRREIFVS